MKAVIVGVGLIGGSIAFDLQTLFDGICIWGCDAQEEHLQEAMRLGIIQESSDLQCVYDADWVFLAVPVDVSVRLLPEILNTIGENTLVIDVGSTKLPICECVDQHPKRHQFLATHPIAGTEFSGPKAAMRGLFEGKTNIICEVEKTAFKLQERAMDLFRKMGMRIRYMDARSHDMHIAYVSHLSHISSFMLGKTVIEKEKDERDIFDMAGSGFESTVRLAKSSPAMWTPIFKQNKAHVIASLNEYIVNLTRFKDLLENEEYEAVYQEMKNTNRIREILK